MPKMPDNWRTSTWGEEVELKYGKALRGYTDTHASYRVFGANGPIGWHDEPLASGPGVILGRKGAYRGTHYSRDAFYVIDTAYYLLPKSKMNMRWLYYSVLYHQLGQIDDGSPIPSTTRSAVAVRHIDVPSLDEQRAIADTLGSLDDKIELNRRMNATLEGMAQAIFRSGLVRRFRPDPEEAGGCQRPGPDHGQPPPRPHPLADLFPASFGNNELPDGWEKIPLLDCAKLISGGTPKTNNDAFWNGDIPWASAKDVSQCSDPFLLNTERSITELGLERSSTKIVPKFSTVVVARGATTGRHCLFGDEFAMNQTCYALSSTDNTPFWLNSAFAELVECLVQAAHGSVFDTITTKTLENVTVAAHSTRLRHSFEETVRPIRQRGLSGQLESQTLATTRDLLLPKLMSGEIRVGEAERLLEDAA